MFMFINIKLLIETMFLNRTRGSQALPLMWKFLEEYQSPQKAVLANVDTLADLLRPLGLQLSIFIEIPC